MAFDGFNEENPGWEIVTNNLLFMIAMLCISLLMWVYWLIDIFSFRHPLPLQDRRPKTWHPLVVLLTLFTVGMIVSLSAYGQANNLANKTKETTIETEDDAKTISATKTTEKSDDKSEVPKNSDLDQKRSMLFSQFVYFLFYMVLSIPLFNLSGQQITDFGFKKTEIRSQIADGCVGFLIHVVPVLLMILITLKFRSNETFHPLLKLMTQGVDSELLSLIVFSAVIMAPLFEELVFRVLLQGYLQDHMHPAFAIVLTSLAFGFIHGWPDMIPIFTFSLVLGYFFYRTNSYLTVVVLHALFNLYNLLNVMLANS